MMAQLLALTGLAVDNSQPHAKSRHVTAEERRVVGAKLRQLRRHKGLTQAAVVAGMPGDSRISRSTLKGIEPARERYPVRETKIECYAAYFGTSITALLREDEPRPLLATNPLLQDLHDEHLEIARRYMQGRKQIRACVEAVLDPHNALALPIAGLVLTLLKWQSHNLTAVLAAFDDPSLPESVLAALCARLTVDAKFRDVILQLVELPSRELPANAPMTTTHTKPRQNFKG